MASHSVSLAIGAEKHLLQRLLSRSRSAWQRPGTQPSSDRQQPSKDMKHDIPVRRLPKEVLSSGPQMPISAATHGGVGPKSAMAKTLSSMAPSYRPTYTACREMIPAIGRLHLS